jgi:hypothetical protein
MKLFCKTMVQNFKKYGEQYFEFLWESSKGGFLIFGNQGVKLTFFLHLNLNFQIYENWRYL